jgi:hypothetical protein
MMAVLAVLLIAGGALLALVLAMRMDSREPVLVAARNIPAGTVVQEADFREAPVASEGIRVISPSQVDQIVGTVARSRIAPAQIIDPRMFVQEGPLASGSYAMVSVLLTPGLVPADEIREGDVVQVIRAAAESGNGTGRALTEGYVSTTKGASRDDFGGGASGSVTLIVPVEAAEAVVDAAANNRAGLAIVSRDNTLDGLSLAVAGN